jgi:hypothetical protein
MFGGYKIKMLQEESENRVKTTDCTPARKLGRGRPVTRN